MTVSRAITRSPAPRWAVSLADIGLLLLGSFAMLNAMAAERANGQSEGEAMLAQIPADELFEPGEARLSAAGEARLRAITGKGSGHRLMLVSRGVGDATDRLDAFELAAARSAVVARALTSGAVAPVVSLSSTGGARTGQTLEIRSK